MNLSSLAPAFGIVGSVAFGAGPFHGAVSGTATSQGPSAGSGGDALGHGLADLAKTGEACKALAPLVGDAGTIAGLVA